MWVSVQGAEQMWGLRNKGGRALLGLLELLQRQKLDIFKY